MTDGPSADGNRGPALVGLLGILGGVMLAALILDGIFQPSPTPLNVLAAYRTHTAVYFAALILSVAFAGFGIPFVAGLGRVLASQSRTVAPGATLLAAFGIAVLMLSNLLSVGALWVITGFDPGPAYQASATYEAAFWSGMSLVFNTAGYMLFGAGLFLFGWLAWKSDEVPRWLSRAAVLGGIVGIATPIDDAVAGPLLLDVVFILWCFVIGARWLRGGLRADHVGAGA